MSGSQLSCIVVDDDEFQRQVISDLVNQHAILSLQQTCSSAMEAYNVLTSSEIDVVFLDIEMPGMSGMELLKNLENRPIVVVISSNPEYALESYEYDVADYLLKPVSMARFLKTIDRVRILAEKENKGNMLEEGIFLKTEGMMVHLKFGDILCLEATGNYVTINTPDKKHMVLMTLKEISAKLPEELFMRVHRSHIINLKAIEAIEDTLIIIKDKLIPIGKSHRDDFFGRINQL